MRKMSVNGLQKFWGWIAVIAMFAGIVNAHEIHLKSGKIIKTPSIQEQGNMVIYQAKGGGTIKISKELVREIIYTIPTPIPVSQKQDSGLAAYYPFNGNANNTINPQNNGVVHGAQLAADRSGTLSSAYWFDGIDDYIQIPEPVLSIPPFSVSFWFIAYTNRPESQYLISNEEGFETSQGVYCKLLGKAETAHARSSWPKSGVQCGLSNAKNGFFALVTREGVTLEQWHHVALVWDGIPDSRYVKLYIDGKLASVLTETGSRDVSVSPGNMRIGAPGKSTSEWLFKGIIDDVRFYNRVISEDEVQQLSHYTRKEPGEQFFSVPDNE
jgi:hypothetical protein